MDVWDMIMIIMTIILCNCFMALYLSTKISNIKHEVIWDERELKNKLNKMFLEISKERKTKKSSNLKASEKQNLKISLGEPIEMSVLVDSKTGELVEEIDASELFKIFSEKMIVNI